MDQGEIRHSPVGGTLAKDRPGSSPSVRRRKLACCLVPCAKPSVGRDLRNCLANHRDHPEQRQGKNESSCSGDSSAEEEHQYTEQRMNVKFAPYRKRQKNKIVEHPNTQEQNQAGVSRPGFFRKVSGGKIGRASC